MTAESLSAEMRDALTEVFNVGIGKAACSLSMLVEEEVLLSVPAFEVMTRGEVIGLLERTISGTIAGVRESFEGGIRGEAVLLFPERKSLELVRSMLKDSDPIETVTQIDQDSLIEVGNILLNACLGSIVNMLSVDLTTRLPAFIHGDVVRIFEHHIDAAAGSFMLFRVDFRLARRDVEGYVLIVLDIQSAGIVREAMEGLMRRFGLE